MRERKKAAMLFSEIVYTVDTNRHELLISDRNKTATFLGDEGPRVHPLCSRMEHEFDCMHALNTGEERNQQVHLKTIY